MANEAVIVELQAGMNAVDFAVANATGISKGCLMSMAAVGTGRTAVKTEDGHKSVFAGIAAAEKEANDGATNVALFQTGIFDLYATTGAAITVGQKVRLSGANVITGVTASDDLSKGYIVGTALESTAAGTAEVIEVDIGLR